MLILGIDVDAASDQELGDIQSVVFAGQVQGRCELPVDQVWFCAGALQQQHEHVDVARSGGPVDHALAELVVEVVLRNFVEFKEFLGGRAFIGFHCLPKDFVHPVLLLTYRKRHVVLIVVVLVAVVLVSFERGQVLCPFLVYRDCVLDNLVSFGS